MQALIDAGAGVEQGAFRPLIIAMESEQPEAMILLIRAGADIPQADQSGFTVLHMMAQKVPVFSC